MMTVREAWEMLRDYPDKIVYFDIKKNEEDVLQEPQEMIAFVSKNKNKMVTDFYVFFSERKVYMTIK